MEFWSISWWKREKKKNKPNRKFVYQILTWKQTLLPTHTLHYSLSALCSSQGFTPMIQRGLGIKQHLSCLVIYCKRSHTVWLLWNSEKNLLLGCDFFFTCSIQLSSCCFILKQVEQFASYCYTPHETIVERIEIISPHSQDFNTENRIKCLVEIDICWLWGHLEGRTVRVESRGGYPASTGWPLTWDILLKISAHHWQGHGTSLAAALCQGLLLITLHCVCRIRHVVCLCHTLFFTLQSGP